MSDCANGDMRDQLPDFLHGRLSASELAEVESHVALCAECRAELELLRDLRATLSRTPAMNVAEIAQAVPTYRAPARQTRHPWRIAAVIAFVAAGGTSLALLDRGEGASPQPTSAPAAGATTARAGSENGPAVTVAPGEGAFSPRGAPGGRTREAGRTAATEGERELAVADGALADGTLVDLSEGELASLLREIDTLDALPSSDVVDDVLPSPVDPRGSVP